MPTIPVSVDFTAEDHASGVFNTIIGQANKLSTSFDHASNALAGMVGVAGGLAAAFGFHHMIEATKEHVEQVEKLRALTGETAESADALSEAFKLGSISAEETTTILGRMSLTALRMEDAMMGIGGPGSGAALMQRTFARLGVDLRQGIVPSMIQLAKRAEEGKLSAMNLRLAMRGLPLESAIKFQRLLAEGPERLRETMRELKESGAAITAGDIESMARMRKAAAEIHSAWERITLVVGRTLLPVIGKLMESVAKQIDGWIEPAKAFGQFLTSYLHEAIGLALTLGKIMLANAALQKMTGVGLLGRTGLIARGAALVRTGAIVGGMTASGAGAGGLGVWAAALAAGAATMTGLAAVIAIVLAGFNALATNLKGARDWLFDSIDGLVAAISSGVDAFLGMFGDITSSDAWDFISLILPKVINTFAVGLTELVNIIHAAVEFIAVNVRAFESGEFWTKGFTGFGAILERIEADVQARKDVRQAGRMAAGERGAEGKPAFNQNFFNSRFDILQKFEEGFDPDRILTAFTNDLAALGERGITSGFQPAYVGSVSKG